MRRRSSSTVVTDKLLQTLRKNNQLHLLSQATTDKQHHRPRSPDEVARLHYWCATFTDSGLKEVAEFKNVTIIDLGRMRITDAGIEHLTKFKKLKFALLHETNISKEGFAKLRKALPRCRVEVR